MDQKQIQFNLSARALSSWNPGLRAKQAADTATIDVFDAIGEDYWTGEGVTAKSVSKALAALNGADVTVNINSPGGSMFEGLTIYNLLRAHKGNVKVNVLGIAASAASIIAMAGDEVKVAKSGFIMIHNAWVMAAGNRFDFREMAEYLEPFDKSMAQIYVDRTGLKLDEVASMMDAESYITGEDSVSMGFADALIDADEIREEKNEQARAAALLDVALAKAGMPRSERRKLLNQIKTDTPNAVGDGTQNATTQDPATGIAAVLSSNLLGIIK